MTTALLRHNELFIDDMITGQYGTNLYNVKYANSRISSKLLYKVPHGITYNGIGVAAIGISGSLNAINSKDHMQQIVDIGVFIDETLTDYLTHMLGPRKSMIFILLRNGTSVVREYLDGKVDEDILATQGDFISNHYMYALTELIPDHLERVCTRAFLDFWSGNYIYHVTPNSVTVHDVINKINLNTINNYLRGPRASKNS